MQYFIEHSQRTFEVNLHDKKNVVKKIIYLQTYLHLRHDGEIFGHEPAGRIHVCQPIKMNLK